MTYIQEGDMAPSGHWDYMYNPNSGDRDLIAKLLGSVEQCFALEMTIHFGSDFCVNRGFGLLGEVLNVGVISSASSNNIVISNLSTNIPPTAELYWAAL